MKDGESSGVISKKEHVMNRVVMDVARVCGGIADGDDMTCVRVDNEELVILASGEKLTVGAVDGEAGRTGAWCELPGGCDLLRSSVDAGDLAERRKSNEDIAIAVGHRVTWTSRKRDRGGDLVGCAVDDSDRMVVRVKSEDGLCGRVESYGCGDAARWD